MKNLMSPQTSSGEFFPALDGIRGLAVLSVVVYHTAYFNPASTFQSLLLSFTMAGFMGVPIFFVLSGFLVSYTIFKSAENFDWKQYTIRRIAKIGPPFLISIGIFSVLALVLGEAKHIWVSAFATLLTLPNFTTGWDKINPVYWSLMVEIHFYLLFPLVYFFCRRISRFPETISIVFFLVVPVLVRLFTHLPEASEKHVWFHNANIFPRALDNFVLGILFATILKNRAAYKSILQYSGYITTGGLVVLGGTYFLYAMIQFSHFASGATFSYTEILRFEVFRALPAIGTFGLLFCIFLPPHHPISRFLTFRPLAYLGIISYEWFLFHYPPVQFMMHKIGDAKGDVLLYFGRTLFPFLIMLLFSALLYHFVSDPVLKYSKQLAKKRNPA